MSWKDLDIRLKAELIKLGVLSGIRAINLIRLLYDDNNTPTLVIDLSYSEINVMPMLGIERIIHDYGIPEEEVNKANDIIQLIENEISLEEINNQLPILFRLFKNGGKVDNPPFMQRILNNDNRSVADWEDPNKTSTHKLSYALTDEGYIVYPEVQEVNGLLHDFTDPKYNHGKWDALDNAIRNSDTLKFSTEELALRYTQEYKNKYPEYFKQFNKGGFISNNPTLAYVGKAKKYAPGGYTDNQPISYKTWKDYEKLANVKQDVLEDLAMLQYADNKATYGDDVPEEAKYLYDMGLLPEIEITADRDLTKKESYLADLLWRNYLATHPIQIGSEEYNRLPEKVKAQVYKNKVTDAMDKAALPTAATIVAPTLLTSVGASVLPAAGKAVGTVLANPFVDAALTVHGAVTAPENVKQGIQLIKNEEYWGGAFNLGLTALDLVGIGNLLKYTYNPELLRNIENIPNNIHKVFQSISPYTVNKNVVEAIKNGRYYPLIINKRNNKYINNFYDYIKNTAIPIVKLDVNNYVNLNNPYNSFTLDDALNSLIYIEPRIKIGRTSKDSLGEYFPLEHLVKIDPRYKTRKGLEKHIIPKRVTGDFMKTIYHELFHSGMRYKPDIDITDYNIQSLAKNTKDRSPELYDIFKPLLKNKGTWEGNPEEFLAELYALDKMEKFPEEWINITNYSKTRNNYLSLRFMLHPEDTESMILDLKIFGYGTGGYIFPKGVFLYVK